MNRWQFFLFLLIAARVLHAGETVISRDGMLTVDGERRFILGLYEEAKDDAFAREASDAGFNLIRVRGNKESLDRAEKFGLQSWIPLSGLAVASDANEALLKKTIETWKSHPALAVWEAPDEALWNVWWRRWNQALDRWREVDNAIQNHKGTSEQIVSMKQKQKTWHRLRDSARYEQAEEIEAQIRSLAGLPPIKERLSDWVKNVDILLDQLKRGCEIVRDTDPNHVLWFNHAPRNSMKDLLKYGTLADITGCDIYPVPFGPHVGHSDLAERNLPSVGRFTQRMAESVPGKPVWMVLQGFGWDDLGKGSVERPQPAYKQSRFMAYDAIVNGARGILYWGTHSIGKDTRLWGELKRLVSELHEIEAFLAAPDANQRLSFSLHPSAFSDEKGIRWLAKEHNGKWALILVNESDAPLAFDIGGLEKSNGKVFTTLDGEESLTVKKGMITYGVPPLEARVLLME